MICLEKEGAKHPTAVGGSERSEQSKHLNWWPFHQTAYTDQNQPDTV